jgi:hypothetical protein
MQVLKRQKLVEKHVYPQNDASASGLGRGAGKDDFFREQAEHKLFQVESDPPACLMARSGNYRFA